MLEIVEELVEGDNFAGKCRHGLVEREEARSTEFDESLVGLSQDDGSQSVEDELALREVQALIST
jgi:hypothetical protein